jgi:hypothetical protein
MRTIPLFRTAATLSLLATLAACVESAAPELEEAAPAGAVFVQPPAAMVSVALPGTGSLTLWPFTTAELATPSDPINLIFTGAADPVQIRAALMALDGSRQAVLPPMLQAYYHALPVLQCRWRDAMGGHQAAAASPAGWTASTVHLECGDYDRLRFHLRIFRVGRVTVANAHCETVIPGTTGHEVLSWSSRSSSSPSTSSAAGSSLPAASPALARCGCRRRR